MTAAELREQYKQIVNRWRRALEDGDSIPGGMLDELVLIGAANLASGSVRTRVRARRI